MFYVSPRYSRFQYICFSEQREDFSDFFSINNYLFRITKKVTGFVTSTSIIVHIDEKCQRRLGSIIRATFGRLPSLYIPGKCFLLKITPRYCLNISCIFSLAREGLFFRASMPFFPLTYMLCGGFDGRQITGSNV